MGILFFNILPLIWMKICQMTNLSKVCQILNKLSMNCRKLLRFCQSGGNFAKSGHTEETVSPISLFKWQIRCWALITRRASNKKFSLNFVPKNLTGTTCLIRSRRLSHVEGRDLIRKTINLTSQWIPTPMTRWLGNSVTGFDQISQLWPTFYKYLGIFLRVR